MGVAVGDRNPARPCLKVLCDSVWQKKRPEKLTPQVEISGEGQAVVGLSLSASQSSFRLGLLLLSFRDHPHLEQVELFRTLPSWP